jgi:hypothetical protein
MSLILWMKLQDINNFSDKDFGRLTGVSRPVFAILLDIVQTYVLKHRSKKGSKSKLSLEEQLLLTLFYLKDYSGLLHLSFMAGVDKSTVCRNIAKIEIILLEAGILKLQGDDVLSKAGAEYVLVVDATEIRIRRALVGQSDSYSGKKKLIPINSN